MASNPLRDSPHRLGLAVFGINVSGGCTMTSGPGTLSVGWPETRRLALAAEAAGFDALIPVARWKGMGGDVNFNHRSWEPFTMASALAAVTERIALFFDLPRAHGPSGSAGQRSGHHRSDLKWSLLPEYRCRVERKRNRHV
ncbi:MAG: hypothetical protein CMQ49_06715 [Gammaproteobacteria bacterium]|nr:hypothetical protein [Gammaproteobacteria bacterium]